jgi:hypothetical protein
MAWILEALKGNKGYHRLDSVTVWGRLSRDKPDEKIQGRETVFRPQLGSVSQPQLRVQHDYEGHQRYYEVHMYTDEGD